MSKIKLRKILLFSILFVAVLLIKNSTYATIISNYYEVDEDKKVISIIEPETTIETFKSKLSNGEILSFEEDIQAFEEELQVYTDTECTQEITGGNIGSGMALSYEDEVYELSVVGDFNKDSHATQLELSKIIKYIVGLKDSELDGIYYKSADLTIDEEVDQRDITKFIKYIVYGELDLGKVDETEPTVMLSTLKQVSNAITARVKADDRESGIPEDAIYTFYYKKSDEADSQYVKLQEEKETISEITGLEDNMWYDIKCEVKDRAGNLGSTTMATRTPRVPEGNEKNAIIFGDIEWNNNMASTTINTLIKADDYGDEAIEGKTYQIEYQVNATNGVWIKGEYVTGLKYGDILYARLTDGTNAGTFIYTTIIDEIEPKVTLNCIIEEDKIKATAGVTDSESGIEKTVKYKFLIKEAGADDSTYVEIQNTTSKTCTFTGLTGGVTYTVKVEVEDIAGNVGIATNNIKIEGIVIPDGTETGAISFTTPTWNSGKAQIGITTSTTFQIEYQVNGTSGTWTKGTTVSNLNSGDIVYARLTDGTTSGGYTSITVVDLIVPQVDMKTTGGKGIITANVTAVDLESGIASGATYKFSIKESGAADSTYTEIQNTTSKTCDFTGLTAGTTYTIRVEISDIAGNKAVEEIVQGTDAIPAGTSAGSILFNSLTWTAGQAEVTISTNTDYKIEYQVNGTSGSWIPASDFKLDVTAKNLNHGDVIYSRLTDGTTAGTYTTLTISDTIKPDVQLNLAAAVETITATANATDSESGIATDVIYIFYIKETGTADSMYIKKQNTTSNILTVPGLVVGKNYTIKVEVEDKAGNKGMQEKSILIPDDIAPVVNLSIISKTTSTATVKASATDVGGLPTPTEYIFYIKETGADDSTYVEKQNGTSDTCTFTGLVESKDYTVKVTVADNARNIGVKETSILTDSIPDITAAGSINFESLTWTSGKAAVEISTKTSYYIEYQVNGTTGTWTRAIATGTNVTATNLNNNDVIYARLTDGTNASGYATLTVVDNIVPESFTISVTDIKLDGFKINGSTIDNQTGLKDYTYVIEKGGITVAKITNEGIQSNNINSISYNNNSTINFSGSNDFNFSRRKWITRKSKRSKNNTNESRSKRKYRNGNNGNTNRRKTRGYRNNTCNIVSKINRNK